MRAGAAGGAAGKLWFVGELAGAESIVDLTRRLYEGISAVFDAVVVGFDVLDPDTHHPRSTSGQGVSEFFLAKYEQVAREADPVLQHAIVNQDLAYNLDMMSEVEWRDLGVYQEVFSLHRMIGVVYAPVVIDGKVVATLNLGRAEGAAAFTHEELVDAVDLAHLLASLMASLQRREALDRELGLYRSALDLASEPMVISDVRSAERYMNKAARRVLDQQPSDAMGFDEALIAVQNRGRQHEPGVGLIRRSFELDGGATVSFLRSDPRPDALPEWFHHSMTTREAQVILLVARGLRDAEIADELHLSVHTVKGYLRDIFKRTGVRSRVELARMALGESRAE
jgi:DNA-binding CsgD family transcriptional regulator